MRRSQVLTDQRWRLAEPLLWVRGVRSFATTSGVGRQGDWRLKLGTSGRRSSAGADVTGGKNQRTPRG